MGMKKILIIEDDISISEVERDYLEVSGFDVDIEHDGVKGLKRALDEDYNLILIDVMLSGMDGFSIIKALRKQKDTPAIMVTARNDEIDKIRGLGLGIDDYVTKPFSPNELVARVKAHINRYELLKNNKIKPKEVIEHRGLVIDPEKREIFVNGNEVELTNKEFELLMLLVGTVNKVFTKEEIFTKVWGFDAEEDIPTLTVHIRKLREKIEYDPSNPQYIMTIWGVGYKFKA